MTRRRVLAGILLALGTTGCGPDCNAFCNKLQQCSTAGGPQVDVARCLLGCNESGGDKAKTIQCYIDHTCTDIFQGGHCSISGLPPGAPPAPPPAAAGAEANAGR